MAPTAVYPSEIASTPSHVPTQPTTKGAALVIGSLSTAQDGKYQSLIAQLKETRQVERQLLDRLVDEAVTLQPASYSSVHVTLSASEYQILTPKLPTLLSQLFSALSPLGTLHLLNVSSIFDTVPSELTLAGFNILSSIPEDSTIIAQKIERSASISLKSKLGGGAAATAVPLLNRKKTDPATKKALWTLTSPSSPMIDAEALLTPADKLRPVPTCEPVNSTAPRRKKACKSCSCGLAELEAEELQSGKVVVLDGSQTGEAVEVTQDERARLLAAAKNAPKATSSCGSCFLGDAFRCEGCPYIGLPAFKPGEKVEIDFGMDDI